MTIEDQVGKLKELRGRIAAEGVEGTIFLADLVDSTKFKSRNPEEVWLPRLMVFRETVAKCLPDVPRKYLGDGVLCFGSSDKIPPERFLESATTLLKAVDAANSELNYREDYRIQVRVVIGFGRVHLFDGTDPQGEAVDKVFRFEKFVPPSCVGITDEIRSRKPNLSATPMGSYRLKGLGEKRHKLFLLGGCGAPTGGLVAEFRKLAILQEFWDLGANGDGKIYVVSGHIPADDGDEQETLQQGDKDAIVGVVTNLAAVGRIDDVIPLTSDKASPYLSENVVCVGGPYWNCVSQAFLRDIQSPFIFEWELGDESPIAYCSKLGRQTFRDRKVGKKLRQDYGFLGRFRNPRNPDRHVILVCGIETPSVAGMVRVFSKENARLLDLHDAILARGSSGERPASALPDFFCLVRFSVDNCSAIPPSLDEQKGMIVTDWLKDHTGQLQADPPE